MGRTSRVNKRRAKWSVRSRLVAAVSRSADQAISLTVFSGRRSLTRGMSRGEAAGLATTLLDWSLGRSTTNSLPDSASTPRFTHDQIEALEIVGNIAPLLFGMPYAGLRSVDQPEDGVERQWPADVEEAASWVKKFAMSEGMSPKKLLMLFEGANHICGLLEAVFPIAEGAGK